MSTEIQVFNFESNEVRTFVDAAGEPWWVAADVCRSINLRNVTEATRPLEAENKGFKIFETPGGKQSLTTVNEPGLYQMIFRSSKEEAKRFRRWVMAVVLPTIRKTGRYVAPGRAEVIPAPPDDDGGVKLLAMIEVIRESCLRQVATEKEVKTQGRRLEALEVAVNGRIDHMGIAAYVVYRGLKLGEAEKIALGKRLSGECKLRRLPTTVIPCRRFGKVNGYPIELLDEWAKQYRALYLF